MNQAKPSRLVRVLRLAIFGAFALSAVLAYQIWSFQAVSTDGDADAAVVLGAAVWGGDPSPVFEQRILHAIELHRAGKVQHLVFTGGKGAGQRSAEAEVARRYALGRGVPAKEIFIETRSHTTRENLVQARRIAEEQGFERVAVVSDPLHMRRAMTIAASLELKAQPSPTTTSRFDDHWAQAWMLARETYFYGSFLANHYLDEALSNDSPRGAARHASF